MITILNRSVFLNLGIILLAFISVNLDFFFMLMFLLQKHKLKDVVIGYLIGTLSILILSYAVGFSLMKIFPEWILGILGIVPIYLAFHDDDDEENTSHHSSVIDVVITYFSTCLGCNLSVFLPILMNKNINNFIYILIFIGALTIIVTFLIKMIMNNQHVINFMDRYGEFAMKICYIVIGIYVFFDSGLVEHVFKILIH